MFQGYVSFREYYFDHIFTKKDSNLKWGFLYLNGWCNSVGCPWKLVEIGSRLYRIDWVNCTPVSDGNDHSKKYFAGNPKCLNYGTFTYIWHKFKPFMYISKHANPIWNIWNC